MLPFDQSIAQKIYSCTRFAPSPTGYLHLGHVLSALWVFGMARILEIRAILRIEDHDRMRCREEYVQAIAEDLEWLGFRWDIYSRQTDHMERFEAILNELIRRGWVYRCFCSRRILPPGAYPGTCRGNMISAKDFSIRTGNHSDYCLRLNLHKTLSDTGLPSLIEWTDMLSNHSHRENPAISRGDPVLLDRYGQWTYQFAVAVDDLLESVDLVIRGADLLDSTAAQIQLRLILSLIRGIKPPAISFLHHPFLTDHTGRKLSKRQLDRSIRAERLDGKSPQHILGETLFRSGLKPDNRPLSLDECQQALLAYFTSS